MVKVAINGFGRIGRLVLRCGIKEKDIDFVAVNDLTDAATLAHLFKYDSVHGIYPGEVKAKENAIIVDGKEIKVLSEKDPSKLPWERLGVEVIIESTGRFRKKEDAGLHLKAGAKKVLISAPAKGDSPVPSIVLGVNDEHFKVGDVVSMASCTTNCLAPIAKVLQDEFGIKRGFMTTVHAYTNDQVILDAPHKDLRRARAAAMSIIPTSTGAAKAIGLVIPELKGKLGGMALRVPVPDGSIVDLAVELEKEVTAEEVNRAMKKASEGEMKGILEYSEEELVSTDIIGNKASSIFDSKQTKANGSLVKVLGWYDNEMGYAQRMVDTVKKLY